MLYLEPSKIETILQDISQLGSLRRSLTRHGVSLSIWHQAVKNDPSLKDRAKDARDSYQAIFDTEDADNDRSITASEYLDSLMRLKIYRIIEKETRDGSGLVTKVEVTKELQLPTPVLLEKVITKSLGVNTVDEDKNGLNIVFDLATPSTDLFDDDDDDEAVLDLDNF